MSPRSRRTDGRRGRTRTFVQRARLGLLALLLAIPLVAAESLPGLNAPKTPVDTSATGTLLSIHEGPFSFEGPANSPTHVLVTDADGAPALEYTVDAEGRARLDVAGKTALADATLLRVEGDPTGDAFALVLRDPEGGVHEVAIDRALLDQYADRSTPPKAPIEIKRPLEWPGAPQRSYLVHVKDAGQTQLAASQLNGAAFLSKSGTHRAVLQIPVNEDQWDRSFLQVRREGQNATLNATFAQQHATNDALVFAASYAPSLLGPAEGERIAIDVIHERRPIPLVVERYGEPATYRYRVDGTGPTVSINAPSQSIDFRFTVTWAGSDALSGVSGFVLFYRESGASTWIHWLTTRENGAVFSGEWGRTYELRARSLDAVGNPSADAFAFTSVVAQPSGEDDINDPPTARFLTPFAGAELAGVVPITWRAEDPDETPVTSRVEISDDDGETYRLLYVGRDLATTWDTTGDADGSGYRIRLTVSDGTQSATDVLSALKVRNVVVPPAPEPAEPTQPAEPTSAAPAPTAPLPADDTDEPATPASDEGGKGVPAPFVGIAIAAAALLAGRRKRA